MKRRVVHRKPPEVLELDKQVEQLQSYLYNFWLKKIKRLAITESLPIEFFKRKYDKEVEVNIRKYIEEIYQGSTKSLEKKLKTLSKKLGRPAGFSSSDKAILSSVIFTSLQDIDNIKRVVAKVKDKFFNSAGRLIGRHSTLKQDPTTKEVEKPKPFSEQAAFNRVGSFGGYSAFNTATQSKLEQLANATALAAPPITSMSFPQNIGTTTAVGTSIGLAIGGFFNALFNATTTEEPSETLNLQYVTAQDERVCTICEPYDGEIYEEDDPSLPELPQHDNCRCWLDLVIAPATAGLLEEGEEGEEVVE